MGFDCVWITPVVKQLSGVSCNIQGYCGCGYHGYWAEDFYAIDARWGSSADLIALSRALKARGMCLIMDIVLNHVRPITAAADLSLVHPFNQREHYHTYGAAQGQTFDEYAAAPRQARPPPPRCPGTQPELPYSELP